jgi:peptide-methionine (S)-S-oxide reductase
MFISKAQWAIWRRFAAPLIFASIVCQSSVQAADAPISIVPVALDNSKAASPLQTAVLAGGCFWGVQGVYEHLRGVRKVVAGYSGGDKTTAHYETVSMGNTGHAESVQITFDPAEISFGEILQVFFSVVHDPTQLNRQGPDDGTQYRSEIFYVDDTQKQVADAYIAQLNKSHVFRSAIMTRVDGLKSFYPAEDYHQDFLIHNPTYPYIVYNDLPKIENLKHQFPSFYRGQAAMVGNVSSP